MATKKILSGQADNLSQRADELVSMEEASAQEALTTEQMQQTLHELRVHQIVLETQNEDLRRRQHELETSRARFFELYDLAPVGYLTLNEQWLIVEANLTAGTLLGMPRNTLLMQPLSRFILPEEQDVYYLQRKYLFDSLKTQSWDMRIINSAGSVFWAHLQAIPALNGECRITLEDITGRKQAEETLQKSDKLYRTTLHTLLDGFWIVDMQGRFIDVNESYCKIIGYTRDELLEMSIQDVEALENKTEIEHRIQDIIMNGSHHFESQHRCKDGHIVDLDICVSNLPNNTGCCASLRDITERKRAEKALRSAAVYTRTLIEASLDPLVTISEDGKITDVNEASVRVTGIPRERLIGTDFSAYFTDPERARDGYLRVFSEGTVHDYPLTIRHISGRVTEVLYNASIYKDEQGNARGVFAAARDVTELKKVSEALKKANDELESRVAERTSELAHAMEQILESEERLRFALENSRTGAWEMNLVDQTAFHSLEHARIFGYPEVLPNWTYKMFLEHVLPENREMVDGNIRRAIESRNAWNFECRIRRTDGQVRWILTAGRHLHNATGDPIRAAGIVQDITIRKLAEEEIVKLNTELEQRVADRTADLDHANEQLRQEIAERQQTENALRLANEEWLNTFNASTDPIMILDCNCRIRRANSSMAALLGMQIEECVGKFCYEQVHHTEAPVQSCPHNQMLKDGRPHTEEIFEEHIGKHLLVTVSPLFDVNGSLVGSMHYIKDITTIKEAEQVLANAKSDLERMVTERTAELAQAHEQMKRVSFELIWAEEKERERIAGELHDQVGQALLLAKMKLDALEDKLSDDSLHTYAADASSLIGTSIQDIRSLTFRMRPPILDTAGIETSLEWLCSSISNDYNLQVEFADDGQPKPLSAELRYSLYQAIRELLLNVVKHAGTETAQLSVTTDNRALVIIVADNGVGFNRTDAIMKHVHNGGYGLYNVRQRIEQMGGRFDVESEPGRGTSVTLHVPLAES